MTSSRENKSTKLSIVDPILNSTNKDESIDNRENEDTILPSRVVKNRSYSPHSSAISISQQSKPPHRFKRIPQVNAYICKIFIYEIILTSCVLWLVLCYLTSDGSHRGTQIYSPTNHLVGPPTCGMYTW